MIAHYTENFQPIKEDDYSYKPFKFDADSILFVHPQNIFDNCIPYTVKRDMKWCYNFYNGASLKLQKGDEIVLFFDHYSQHPLNYEFRYYIYVKNNEGQFEQKASLCQIAWNDQDSDKEYSFSLDNVKTIVKNLEKQLEGLIPNYDDILNNQKPSYSINIGDTFIGFGWDNGLDAIKITDIKDGEIYFDKHLMSHHNYNTYFGTRSIETTTIDWLIKYYCKLEFDFDNVLNDKLHYKTIIDDALLKLKEQRKTMFETSLKELSEFILK